jgi:hypothetical protein
MKYMTGLHGKLKPGLNGVVMNIRMLMIFLLLSLTTIVWANEDPEKDESEAGSHRRASPDGAAVGFVGLKDGDVLVSPFELYFSVTGMGISPAGTDVENAGHHHLLIDVENLPDLNLPIPKSEQFVHFGGGQTESVVSLPAGKHTLRLLYGDYAHIPHHPVVMSEIITIQVVEE